MDRPVTTPCETLAERYQALLEVAQAISAQRDLDRLFRDLAHRLPRVMPVNYVDLSLHDPIKKVMRLHTIQANVPAGLIGGHEIAIADCPAGLAWRTQQPLLVPDLSEERRWLPARTTRGHSHFSPLFHQRYAVRMKKNIQSVPARTIEVLSRYAWPGNIRELENLVERSVILTQGTDLQVPVSELQMESCQAIARQRSLKRSSVSKSCVR